MVMIKRKLVKLNNSIIKKTIYNPLSPTDNAEGCDIYIESLEWALENKKKIRNIAISGPYGSGKSSVLQTFIKRKKESNKNLWYKLFPKYRFFNISLATFKDIKNNSQDNIQNTELQRLIELSILQQLFFHEKDSKIPDSRFKKIKRQKRISLLSYSIGLITLLISVLFLLAPNFLSKFSIIDFSAKKIVALQLTASIIILVSLLFITYKISRSIVGFSIKKLKINSAEIEIDKGISKSILNNHLDEIIYFFEATKYNIVIIEDLDRFEQTEVFTKLREINLLINNSKKVKRDIVFIYAIKDDMFLDKDRAKFFDFMIPIIPVINFSNSGNKLRGIVKQNNFNIKDELLDDLSMFIDDMRLLYNIMNEFYVYSKKVNNGLDMNKLLSIIVYKNIYPNDFTKLNENSGDLYLTIRKKNEYINTAISELDTQIINIKDEIKKFEKLQIENIKELRIVYLTKVIEKINNGFVGFNSAKGLIRISDFTSDDHFSKILGGQVDYYNFNSYYRTNETSTLQFNFSEIENQVSSELTYKEREDYVLDRNKINNLKKEIEKINEQKYLIQKSKLKDILSNKLIVIGTDSERKNDLINILLRNGYIDENYLDYISIFHEGALTKSDYQFLINIKTEKKSSFDFKLHKGDELFKKINEFAFEKEFILNFDMLDVILKSRKFPTKKKNLFDQLGNESEIVISFIDEYIERTTEIELFISELCKNWLNIWNYIFSKSLYTEERIDKYFRLIIQYADLENIEAIFINYKPYLNSYSDFLNIPTKKGRITGIIEKLNLKFNSINIDSPETYLQYILENNYYAINIEMIRTLLSFNKSFKWEEFSKSSYSYISISEHWYLLHYIESNINEYVSEVFLKLDNNSEEKIENYLQLLDNTDLKLELKEKVIEKTNTTVENVSDIHDVNVWSLLFKHSKVDPKWENILVLFEEQENKFSDEVINFLNNLSNAEILSQSRMTAVKNEDGIGMYSNLCNEIIHDNHINSESYKLLTKSIPWWYESFTTERLPRERINMLIESNKINPTVSSYEYLRDNYKGTNINLLESYFVDFEEDIKELTVDGYDLENILKAKSIDLKYKFNFLRFVDEEIIIENPANSKIITKYLIDSDSHKVSDSIISLLIKNIDVSAIERIKLFNKFVTSITKIEIEDFLASLSGDYSEITNTLKKATLENNLLNQKLLGKLIDLDYISSFSNTEKGLRVNHKRKE